jgi:hypothetical protein
MRRLYLHVPAYRVRNAEGRLLATAPGGTRDFPPVQWDPPNAID